MRYAQLLRFITPHRRTLLAVVLLLLAVTAANLDSGGASVSVRLPLSRTPFGR